MAKFSTAWDETKPAGTRSKLLGDDDFREFKTQFRQRFGEDHVSLQNESDDALVGFHNKTTFPNQASDPLPLADAFILFAKKIGSYAELHGQHENIGLMEITKLGRLNGAMFGNLAAIPSAAGLIPAANLPATTTLSQVYPVGCIYTSTVATNPNTVFGMGTWVAFGAGKVLVGLNGADTDFDVVEETGGSKTNAQFSTNAASAEAFQPAGSSADSASRPTHTHVVAAAAFSLVQPYIVVYFWKRTA